MLLLLSRAPEQQAALDKFVEELHTPESPNYRHWITPAQFGDKFGPADTDIQTITGWLEQQGFKVARVAAAKNVIEFSGSAGQLRKAFHTEIHKYAIQGQEYWANSQDPKIPAALAPVVKGLVSLNNFPRKPLSHRVGVFSRDRDGVVTPAFTVSKTSGTYYGLGPADFSTIYNTTPMLQSGNNGAGQTIAILGRSNVHLQDITDFRNLFGLGAGNTSVVIDGPDPGIVTGDESESLLDLEWANAVAPGAAVILVSAQDTETTSGLDLAALHVIESNLAGIMSVSYGSCEAHIGTAGNQYFQSLWQQAAAQGITVIVSSGDDGSAGCDNQDIEDVATSGLAVNGLASTAFNVAVGGTDFDDAGMQSSYWNSTNDSTTLASARSYIPEMTWNETCAAAATAGNLNVCPAVPSTGAPPASLNLLAGSGGPSSCATSSSSGGTITCQGGRAKPAWQSGIGVPSDGVRDVPDISLFASAGSNSKSFYVVCEADEMPLGFSSCQRNSNGMINFFGAGGTSAAAPSFAGIIALAEQKVGARLGNVNYLLYSLAAGSGASCGSASSSGSCIFNDVTKGNISVPCQGGSANCSQDSGTATGVVVDSSQSPAYSASSGYDFTTGLGSVNAANLVNGIVNSAHSFSATSTTLSLNGATSALTAQHGDSISVGVSVAPPGSGDVSLLGSSGGIDSGALTSGSANWASTLFPGGAYAVKAHYPGDAAHGASDSNMIAVTINPEPSQSFINLVTFDTKGALQSFTSNNVTYGSNYLLRVDVTDGAGTVSSAQGVNSKCSSHTASCPTGTLTVTANGSPLDGGSLRLNSKGFAEDQIIQLAAGNYTLNASYSGDSSYTASSGSSGITIAKAPTVLTAATPDLGPFEYGRQFQMNARLLTNSSGAPPTGNITFTDNGATASTNVFSVFQNGHPGGPSGYAGVSYTASYSPTSIGTHTVSAQYPGDNNYLGSSSSSFSFTAVKGNTFVNGYGIQPRTATPNFAVALLGSIFTNSALSKPTGTVTFTDNGNPISGPVIYGGQDGSCCSVATLTAQMNFTFSQVGNHHIVMSYSGDGNYNPVSQDLGNLVVVDKIPTSVNFQPLINLSANTSVFLSVTINSGNTSGPIMGGTVAFHDGSTSIPGNINYSSQTGYMFANVPYAFTTPGTHDLTVQYSGDSIYAPTSQTFSVRVLGPLAIEFPGGLSNPTFIATASSGTANIPLFVANSTNTSMAVALSCTSASNNATCSLSPSSSVSLPAFSSMQITANINVPKGTASLHYTYPFTIPFVFGSVLAGLSLTQRKKHLTILAALVALSILPLGSCGGGGGSSSNGGGPSSVTGGSGTSLAGKTFSFTVTATSGANTDTESFSVTFQ